MISTNPQDFFAIRFSLIFDFVKVNLYITGLPIGFFAPDHLRMSNEVAVAISFWSSKRYRYPL